MKISSPCVAQMILASSDTIYRCTLSNTLKLSKHQQSLQMAAGKNIRGRNQTIKPPERTVNKVSLLAFVVVSVWLITFHASPESIEREDSFVEAILYRRPAQLLRAEFHLVNNSTNVVVPDIDQQYDPSLEQIWQCKDQDRSDKKLVFVHVFKTAGSTIRSILQAYSHHCNAGLAIVVSCTSLSVDSLRMRTTWRNNQGRRAGNQCILKKAFGREQNMLPIPEGESINATYLEQHIDILGGHLPMGSDFGWKNHKGQQVDAQYLVFLRDASRKYVSGVLYKNPKLTMEEIILKIKAFVINERSKKKYYEKYSSYLISPTQIEHFSNQGIELTREQRVNLTMVNLLQSKIVIGIVERMSESMELMKYTLDRNNELTSMFEFFGMKDKSGKMQSKEVNKSILSSSAVLLELEKDPEFMEILREYVKYDNQIHTFAMELHRRQYQAMQKAQNSSEVGTHDHNIEYADEIGTTK